MSTEWEILAAISSAVSASGIIIALLVYLLNRKTYYRNIDFKRKENAINIATKYAQTLKNVSFLFDLYISFGNKSKFIGFSTKTIKEYSSKNNNKPLLFNADEYEKVFNKKDIVSEIEQQFKENVILFLEIYMAHYDAVELKPFIEKIKNKNKIDDANDVFELDRVFDKYSELQADTLNELEVMCMSFNCNIADEEIVFSSLHQTLRDLIMLMYPAIASTNIESTKKYYTNIIKLYNHWTARYIKNCEKIKKQEEKIAKLKQNSENEINKSRQIRI